MWLCYYWQCSEFLCFSTPGCAPWRWLYFHCVPLSDGVRKSLSFSYVNVDCSTVWASLLHILYRKTAHSLSKVVWAKVLKQQKLKCLLHTCSGHHGLVCRTGDCMQRRHHMTMYGLNLSGYVFDAYSVTFIRGDCLYGKPGNVGDFELTAVTEMSGILLQVSEVLSGKRGDEPDRWSKRDYLLVFKIVLTMLSLCISFWFWIMHCCIPTPPLTITLVQAWHE